MFNRLIETIKQINKDVYMSLAVFDNDVCIFAIEDDDYSKKYIVNRVLGNKKYRIEYNLSNDYNENYYILIDKLIDNQFQKDNQCSKENRIKSIINSSRNRFDNNHSYCLYVLRTNSDNISNVKDYITSFALQNVDIVDVIDTSTILFLRQIPKDDNTSYRDMAILISDEINKEYGAKVKVSFSYDLDSIDMLKTAFDYCMEAFDHCKDKDVFTMSEFIFDLLLDNQCANINKYVYSGIKSVVQDSVLDSTAMTFIDHSLNISSTARDMYVHRNTLMMRIKKIEKLTGLDLMDFNQSASYKILRNSIR